MSEATGVMGYVEQFLADVDAADLTMVARHRERSAGGISSGRPPLLLEGDAAPLGADPPNLGEDRGEMPDFYHREGDEPLRRDRLALSKFGWPFLRMPRFGFPNYALSIEMGGPLW